MTSKTGKSSFRAQQGMFDFEQDGIPVNVPIPPKVESEAQKRERIRARIAELEAALRAEAARKAAEAAAQAERARAERARAERERQQRERQKAWDDFRARMQGAHVNPWTVLGVTLGADKAAVRAAWLRLVQQHHPDHGGNPVEFRKVQWAYERITGKTQKAWTA